MLATDGTGAKARSAATPVPQFGIGPDLARAEAVLLRAGYEVEHGGPPSNCLAIHHGRRGITVNRGPLFSFFLALLDLAERNQTHDR